jgi:hypothetical protein
MVGGSLWVLRLLPTLKLVAMLLLDIAESGIIHQKSINQSIYRKLLFKQ